jgi:hypothetical protein
VSSLLEEGQIALAQSQDAESRLRLFSKAEQLDPNNTAAQNTPGVVHRHLQQREKAADHVRQAVLLDSYGLSHVLYMADVVHASGQAPLQLLFESNGLEYAKPTVCEPNNSWIKEEIEELVRQNRLMLHSIDEQTIADAIVWYLACFRRGTNTRRRPEMWISSAIGFTR